MTHDRSCQLSPASAAVLRQQALKLLARRDYSRFELRQRLLAPRRRPGLQRASGVEADDADAAAGVPPAVVDVVLDALEAERLLSDRRVAEGVVLGRAARYGRARLSQVLKTKGVDAELAEAVLSPLRETEDSRALAQLQRRFPPGPVDQREKARRFRFLIARGFDADTVARVVRVHAGQDGGSDGTVQPDGAVQ